jgi:dihydroorotase
MILKNVKWFDTSGSLLSGNVVIAGERISELQVGNFQDYSDREGFDCAGFMLLPGFIDPHVHFREPGQEYKEGIGNGSAAAVAGGVTTVLDMPNNRPPCDSREAFFMKRRLFQAGSVVNWGLHILPGDYDFSGYSAVKIFFSAAGASTVIRSASELCLLFAGFPRFCIHIEDEAFFSEAESIHHLRRPRAAITGGLKKIDEALSLFTRQWPGRKIPQIILLHISTVEELEWLSRKKARGLDIYGETAPHYLFFTQDEVQSSGALLRVNPPIRTESDRLALCRAVADGLIDFIGSDHAPHVLPEKQSANPPSGIPGIEFFGPLLLKLWSDGLFSGKRLLEIACEKAAKCYGIKGRDGIKVGNYADLVLYEKNGVAVESVITRAGYNPYVALALPWRVRSVIINGQLVFENKQRFCVDAAREVYEQSAL